MLADVTLVSITGVNTDAAHEAMQRSMEHLTFGRALLIATTPPSNLDRRIEWRQIPPMNLRQYSYFVLKQLHRHISTSHALIVQADGFVLNPELWDNSWLAFDYIGAPWPEFVLIGKFQINLTNRVGNGGFSLRSKRLLEMTAPVDMESLRFPTVAEDMITAHLLHGYLTKRGMRFADIETASRFSVEYPLSADHTLATTFGFHGKRHLAQVLEEREERIGQ